jgi:hypothetical protein
MLDIETTQARGTLNALPALDKVIEMLVQRRQPRIHRLFTALAAGNQVRPRREAIFYNKNNGLRRGRDRGV